MPYAPALSATLRAAISLAFANPSAQNQVPKSFLILY